MGVVVNQRLPQAGRIRIGRKVATSGGRMRPEKSEVFILTSADKTALDMAAKVYGGKVKPWDDPKHQGEYVLETTSKELAVYVPPQNAEPWYELWSAVGNQRRCDGNECTIPDGQGGIQTRPCMCNPDTRECKLTLRVQFLLPDVPTLGVWRFDTSSIHTCMEMPAMLRTFQSMQVGNVYPEAVLALERRVKNVIRPDGKPQTNTFYVCTLRIRRSLREMMGGLVQTEVPAIAESKPASTPRPRRAIEQHVQAQITAGEPETPQEGNKEAFLAAWASNPIEDMNRNEFIQSVLLDAFKAKGKVPALRVESQGDDIRFFVEDTLKTINDNGWEKILAAYLERSTVETEVEYEDESEVLDADENSDQ